MLFYHPTDAADVILRERSRDGEGSYVSGVILHDGCLSDARLDTHEDAGRDQFLEVELSDALA